VNEFQSKLNGITVADNTRIFRTDVYHLTDFALIAEKICNYA